MIPLPDCPDWPDGVRFQWHASIDSTNAEAGRRCAQGDTGPAWIVAGEQTSGRGRRGRGWTSMPGNVYATLLVTVAAAPASAAQTGFVAALAVRDAARDLIGESACISLKWPNDVLADGRKFCGILGETLADRGDGRLTLAIGIGLNLAAVPAETRYPAAALADFAPAPAPPAAACRLAVAMAHWLGLWDEGRGFGAIRAAWTAHAAGLGEWVEVDGGGEALEARITRLAADGALVVTDAAGREHRVYAGDVSIGRLGASRTAAGAAP